MTLVQIGAGHRLAPAPAASWLRMVAAGCPATITSSTRTAAEQQALRDKWEADPVNNPFARVPGQSKHQTGEALDLKRPAAAWVRAHPDHGWRFTDPNEWWHAEYLWALDQHRATPTPPAPLTPTTTREDTDMVIIKKGASVYRILFTTGRIEPIDPALAQSMVAAGVPLAAGTTDAVNALESELG